MRGGEGRLPSVAHARTVRNLLDDAGERKTTRVAR